MIGTDRITHPLQGRDVVDELQRVQLERDPIDAVVRAWAANETQSGIASSHWRLSRAVWSSGQVDQTQLSVVPPEPSPGQPDIVTILWTPSRPASSMVFRMSSTWAGPTTGCSGHAEQLSAAIVNPREASCSWNRARLAGSPSSSSIFRCGADDWPPAGISRFLMPSSTHRSSICSNGISRTESVCSASCTEPLLWMSSGLESAGVRGLLIRDGTPAVSLDDVDDPPDVVAHESVGARGDAADDLLFLRSWATTRPRRRPRGACRRAPPSGTGGGSG